jgi:hypothetical protein
MSIRMMFFLRIVLLQNNSQFERPWCGTVKAGSNVKEREAHVGSEAAALGRYSHTESDGKSRCEASACQG